MDVVAHRGYAAEFPENTVRAFRGAAADADWIEFDVRRCGSGEVVVFHDGTVERVTDAEGAVGCTPWRTLRDLDVLGSGEGVPRLGDALDAIPSGVGVQIELKELGLVADISDALADHDNPAILISFNPLALQEAREVDPGASLGHVLHDDIYGDDPELGIDTAAHLGCDAVHMYYATGSDPAVVAYAHDRGLTVQTAVPEAGPTDQVLDRCRSAGVDRLSTDQPPLR